MSSNVVNPREISFLTGYGILLLFLGAINVELTNFFVPDGGEELYKIANFYLMGLMICLVLIVYKSRSTSVPKIPEVPSIWVVILNFMIFLPIFFFLFYFLFTRSLNLPIPTFSMILKEGVISFSENLMALILIPILLPYGTGVGTTKNINLLPFKAFPMILKIPMGIGAFFNIMKYSIKGVLIITLFHAGTYSKFALAPNELYFSIFIAFIMFNIFNIVREMLGFGTSEAAHAAWNLALVSMGLTII